MPPLFSIIIPCYNQAIYLSDCLDSIITQSEENWEAIIINDGSTDNTNLIAKEYCLKDRRIKYFEKKNGGLSSARNEGIKNVSGRRIIFMDSDDYFYPNCFAEINKTLTHTISDDYLVVTYGYSHITTDKKKVLHSVVYPTNSHLLPSLFYGNIGPPNSICVSKLLCDHAGFFDENLKSVEDWDYWLRVAKSGALLKEIKLPLVYYRYVKNSMSRNAFVMYEALKKVIDRSIKKDNRITIESDLNKNYNIDTTKVLQEALIRSLGVSIMQGKIEESVELFKKESKKLIEEYQPEEYQIMCSYLSFRYWYSENEINEIIISTIPEFILFFKKIGYSNTRIKKIIFFIFNQHLCHLNKYRFGSIIGTIINAFMRRVKTPLFIKME